MQATINAITQILGRENVFDDPATCLALARSASYHQGKTFVPFACAKPRHIREAASLLSFCNQEGIPVVFRGGGTSSLLPAQPQREDTLLILSTGLNRILAINPENMEAIVQPGVTVAELAQAAAQKALFFPPQPWSAAVATIGGAIAVNAAGTGFLKYGPITNYINALELLLPTGQILPCHGANGFGISSGPPIASLLAGSGGAFGFIGTCALRLLPIPPHQGWIIARFPDFKALSSCVTALLPIGVVSLELFDRLTAAQLLGSPAESPLLAIEIQGENAEYETVEIVAQHGGAPIPLPEYTEKRAAILPGLFSAKGPFILTQVASPPAQLSILLEKLQELAADTPLAVMGHAGIARLQVAIFADKTRATTISSELFRLSLLLNNALEKETDLALSPDAWLAQHSELQSVARQMQKSLDPGGILPPLPPLA